MYEFALSLSRSLYRHKDSTSSLAFLIFSIENFERRYMNRINISFEFCYSGILAMTKLTSDWSPYILYMYCADKWNLTPSQIKYEQWIILIRKSCHSQLLLFFETSVCDMMVSFFDRKITTNNDKNKTKVLYFISKPK